MTEKQQAIVHAARRRCAVAIIANHEKFKVCSGCIGIAHKNAKVCPLCRTYRWWEKPEAVIMAADLNSRYAFPVTSATIPRYEFPIDGKDEIPHIV